ncbi:MAG: T9SS type A sorting domain-containing protein [Bacteroidales bacterium]|nr:T9SS type A sorting domain-containing protein [Bacteroidales bacterium]
MKKNLFFLLTLLLPFYVTAQPDWDFFIDFDPPWGGAERVRIDTIQYPSNIWQIGQPAKALFTSAFSPPNAIVTDLINTYPPNDTSVFYVFHDWSWNMPFHIFGLHFMFQMNTDSTTTFGKVEVTGDNGTTWINVMEEDTIYDFEWWYGKPTLTGNSGGWTNFDCDMANWASGWGGYPSTISADTVWFRFTFYTGPTAEDFDGWIIDDIWIEDWCEGVESHHKPTATIFPNPATDKIKIFTSWPTQGEKRITIFNLKGEKLFQDRWWNQQQLEVNVSAFTPGIYFLNLVSDDEVETLKLVIR